MSLLNNGIMPYPVLPSREAAHQSHEAEKVKICIQRGKATRDQKDTRSCYASQHWFIFCNIKTFDVLRTSLCT